MTFDTAINYLNRFSNYEKKAHQLKARFSLEPIRGMMRKMDHPQKQYPAVHVAGTVGKGSICHMLEAILAAAGYSAGLYTSPHLNDIRERIRINSRMISKNAFAGAVDKVRARANDDFDRYTYFEILTAAAFQEFADRKVDLAIIETGLGGRLDATNVIRPLISVIATIGRDHMHVLGDRLSDIAAEKAGIIKHGAVTVSAPQKPSAMKVIRETCSKKHSSLIVADTRETVRSVGNSGGKDRYQIKMTGYEPFELALPLAGGFQAVNLATVIKTAEQLSNKGFEIGPLEIKRGIEDMSFPGRMERIAGKTKQITYILDGAHNEPAAKALASHLIKTLKNKHVLLIVAMMKDKDYDSVLRELRPIGNRIIVCGLPCERAWAAGELARFAAKYFSCVLVAENMENAVKIAEKKLPPGGCVCITGSLYAVAEARFLSAQ